MAERPSAGELLEAVRRFIDAELLPELEGVHRFHARVAANALGIVGRELELGRAGLERRCAALAELLERDPAAPESTPALERTLDRLELELVERIRAGEADGPPLRDRVLSYLELSVRERLAVDNPGYR